MAELFGKSNVFGTFKGFQEHGLEFAAEIIAPYDVRMVDQPQLGQFVLVELGSPEEATLGRITRFIPSGLLTSSEGEDYVNTMQRRDRAVPEDLKEQRLKYRVSIKLLGAVKNDSKGEIVYVPSQRRFPHLGARVAAPSDEVLKQLCKLSGGTTHLGNYALGEFIYSGIGYEQSRQELRSVDPRLEVTFDVKNLVARRSLVFARAGYGKSNLMKLLLSELYREEPVTERGTPVGTLIFDADGEYFWPDHKGRPGLCDVPHLRDRLVVFTNRDASSPWYGSWKLGEVKLDLRELRPHDVIGIAVSPERQNQQNVLKLRGLHDSAWRELIDLIYADRLQANEQHIGQLLGYSPQQIQQNIAEIAAAKSNMWGVVSRLHDPNSRLLKGAIGALSRGGIVAVDISLLSGTVGTVLSGLLLRRIFGHNQENFTGGQDVIPAITIIEEAQSVLGKRLDDSSPFVEWVKEGRKYDLGAIMITQQPGSMAPEIMSQADNWFAFHLLSEADAKTLGFYNAHFSDDILSHLIAEPIIGNCFAWSAPTQPFVLPCRVHNFEARYGENVLEGKVDATEPKLVREMRSILDTGAHRLARALLEHIIESGNAVRFVRLPGLAEDPERAGIYSGQLYHLIEHVKTLDDGPTSDHLKEEVMEELFGAGCVTLESHNGKDYHCASIREWERVLGRLPSSLS